MPPLEEYVDKIGIELEGGWDEIPAGGEIIADLSIDGNTFSTDKYLTDKHVGEIVSPPLPLEDWKAWAAHFWPTSINITCGLHIHTSFKEKRHYALLMKSSFERKVRASQRKLAEELELPKKHYIWHRLDGANPFALFGNVAPSEQVGITEKRIGMRTRYAALNYCFSMHGTIEYRVLPMFDVPAEAFRFVDNYLACIHDELVGAEQKRFYFSASLKEVNGCISVNERSG